MKDLDRRTEKLKELREALLSGPKDRRIALGSYLQLLDLHLILLTEINMLATAMRDGQKQFVEDWIELRIKNDGEIVHTAECQNSQQSASESHETGTTGQET